jgi:hypothetical protein
MRRVIHLTGCRYIVQVLCPDRSRKPETGRRGALARFILRIADNPSSGDGKRYAVSQVFSQQAPDYRIRRA